MHILLSDKRYTYTPQFRFIKPKDQQKVKVKFSNELVLAMGYRLNEQIHYFTMAAEAAFMSLNTFDRQKQQFFVELDLMTNNHESINLQPDSTSVGLGYAIGAAIAFRKHLGRDADNDENIFTTGEISASGNVHSVGHINNKIEGALYAMSNQDMAPFKIFYPKANHDEIDANLVNKVEKKNGTLHPIEHLSQALQVIFKSKFDGSQIAEALTFKGLCSFEPHDEYYFFGREQQTEELVSLFYESPTLIKVHGVSGSGKSSLIKAGLLPALSKAEKNLKWHIAKPKQFKNSRELLNDFITSESAGFSTTLNMLDISVDAFIDTLVEQSTVYLDEISAHLTAHKSTYVWVIDQFEESYDDDPNSTLLQSLALIGEITPISIIVSIRSEYLHYTGMVGRDHYVPHSLSAESWINIIENQAIALGIILEEDLAQTIQTEALKLSHALPAVEYLLTQMHSMARTSKHPKKLTVSQYNQLNKLTGVIYKQAEKILGQYEPLTEQFFELFVGVNLNGTCYAKHVDFVALEQNYPQLKPLVDALIEKQLIIRHQVYKLPPYVKLTHDCLITIAEDLSLDQQIWPRFYIWLNDRKEYLKWFHGIEAKYIHWLKYEYSGEHDQQQHFLLTKHELNEGTRFLSQTSTVCLQEVRKYVLQSQNDYQTSLESQNKRQHRRLFTTSLLFLCALGAASLAYVQKQQLVIEQTKTNQALAHLKDNVLINIDSLEPIIVDYLPTFQRKYLNTHLTKLISSVDDIPLRDIDKLKLLLIRIKILRQDDSTHISEIENYINEFKKEISHFSNTKKIKQDHKHTLAQFNYELGALLLKQGEPNKAKAQFNQAINMLDELPSKQHGLSLLKAQLNTRLGTIALESGETESAATQFKAVLSDIEKQKPSHKFEQAYNNVRVDLFRSLAKASSSNQQATHHLMQAKTILEQLLASDPNHLVAQYNLLRTIINLAEISNSQSSSYEYYLKANKLAERYAIKDPDNVHIQVAQLLLYTRLGKEYLDNKEMHKAQKHLLSGVEIASKLKRLNNKNTDWQGHSIELYVSFANYYVLSGMLPESQRYYDLALDTAEKLTKQDPNNLDFAYLLQGVHSKIATYLYNQGDKAAAITQFEKAKVISLMLTNKNATNHDYIHSYRKKLFNLGYISTEMGKNKEACDYFLSGKQYINAVIDTSNSGAFLSAAKRFDHYLELLSCNQRPPQNSET